MNGHECAGDTQVHDLLIIHQGSLQPTTDNNNHDMLFLVGLLLASARGVNGLEAFLQNNASGDDASQETQCPTAANRAFLQTRTVSVGTDNTDVGGGEACRNWSALQFLCVCPSD